MGLRLSLVDMESTLLSRRDIDFLLFEWLGVDDPTKRDRFGEHSRETFEGLLTCAWDLATRYFRAAQQEERRP